ncbi:hypothetical protein Tco_0790843 [Tanacetum coccineum]
MEISIADQIALDDALVAPADRLKIGKCNLRLSSDVTSKEATLQVVYDVLKLTPFYKAFQVTADAPEIYMQEFWASAYVHNRSVRFKMNNKKHIIGLDQFRDILQICPKVGNKNGKPSYDSLRLSQAQILWGMYNKKNVDYAYLLWEDFIFQIENKNTKKGNAMYYPRFTKLVVNFVMDKDPSIPRRNKVNWHYARDDPMFTTINVISRNEDTQLYGTILPVALTNEDIRNSESYKEYYAIASGMIPPKTKGSKKKADTDTITKQKPPTVPKEKKSGKGKQKSTELETISEAVLTEAEQLKIITKRSRKETHSSQASGSGADEGTYNTLSQDDEDADKNDVNETTQDDEDDDEHDDNEKAQDDDDEEQTESEDDLWRFYHPKLTTMMMTIIHEEENWIKISFDPTIHTPLSDFIIRYEDTLSSIPGIIDQYLANKMQEAVDVAVQLKCDRIREESSTANQQFLDSIGFVKEMRKVSRKQVKKEVSKITQKLRRLSIDQLESEVLNQQNLLDTYGDTVTIKRPRDGADDDQEPSAGTDRGSKRRRSGKEPASTSAPSETTTTTAGKTTTTGSKTHKQSASQSALVEETMQTTDVFEAPAHQEFETGVHDEQAEEEVQHLPDWFQQPTRLPSPDHAWNKSVPAVHESVQPWLSNLAT